MLRGPGFTLTFFYYFAFTTLIMAFFLSQETEMTMFSPYPYRYGMIIGAATGILGAYSNHSQTISTSFKKKKDFETKLEVALAEMGFQEYSQDKNLRVYGQSRLRNIFSGKIFVQIEKRSASISGRAMQIRKLSSKLESVSSDP